MGFGVLLGLYLIGRAAAEPFVIDMTDPASYRHDWGGSSLAGVMAVHCGPGIISAVLIGRGCARGGSAGQRRRSACPGRGFLRSVEQGRAERIAARVSAGIHIAAVVEWAGT